MTVTVGQILRDGALRHGERVAVVEHSEAGVRVAHSYAELDRAARGVAADLAAAGVRPRHRVALIGANSAEFLAAWFGIIYAGATAVPVPGRSVPRDVTLRATSSACRVILSDASHRDVAERGAPAGVAVRDIASHGEPVAAPHATDPEDTALILYTSGTTGVARGAMISHASMLLHTASVAFHTLNLGPADCILGVLPLTHSFGLRMVALASLYAGARCVLLPRFEASASLEIAAAEVVTWIPGVPTMFARWAALESAPPLPGLRWCLSAGAPLPEAVAVAAGERLGAEVRQGYGMTEATFSTMDAPPTDRRPGSVGPPTWGVEVRIVDADEQPLPPGVDGEIRVRGHHVMSRYLDAPDATAASLVDGWIRTGDIGRLDPDGALRVVDRTKDLIIRGGFNVYPSDVEGVLQEHASVAQVAVVGRPSDDLGEAIVAFVVLTVAASGDTAAAHDAIVAHARVNLSAPRRPDVLRFVDSLPLGPSAKVLRRVLREWV